MAHFRSKPGSLKLAGALLGLLVAGSVMAAAGAPTRDAKQTGLFLKTLLNSADQPITNDPDDCLTKIRPVTVKAELGEILFLATGEAKSIGVKSSCETARGAEPFQFCRLYVHSVSRKNAWSMGFTFLGRPENGEIQLESLSCFNT